VNKKLRILCVVLASILLLTSLFSLLLYNSMKSAFPPGEYSTLRAARLWFDHVTAHMGHAEAQFSYRSCVIYPNISPEDHVGLANAASIPDYLEETGYQPGHCFVYEEEGIDKAYAVYFDPYRVIENPVLGVENIKIEDYVAGVKALEIDGEQIGVKRSFAFAMSIHIGYAICVFDTEDGYIFAVAEIFDVPLSEGNIWVMRQEEYARFLADNSVQQSQWLEEYMEEYTAKWEAEHPGEEVPVLLGLKPPPILVDMNDYDLLDAKTIY